MATIKLLCTYLCEVTTYCTLEKDVKGILLLVLDYAIVCKKCK